jgi:hypothetical protein
MKDRARNTFYYVGSVRLKYRPAEAPKPKKKPVKK